MEFLMNSVKFSAAAKSGGLGGGEKEKKRQVANVMELYSDLTI